MILNGLRCYETNAVSTKIVLINLGQVFAVFVVALEKCCLYQHFKSHPQVAVIMSCFSFLFSLILFFWWFANPNVILTPLNICSQLSPGRDGSDTDMEPTASQSQDCEPTPPLQRHGSKNNFYLSNVDSGVQGGDSPRHPHQLRGGYGMRNSPHPTPYPLAQQHQRPSSRSHTPDPLSPSPTMQQRVKAIGIATPLAMSSPVRRCVPSLLTLERKSKIFILPCWWCISELNNLMVQVFISTWHALALSWQVGGNYCFLVDGAFSTLYLCSYHTGFGFHFLRDYHVLTSCKIDLKVDTRSF